LEAEVKLLRNEREQFVEMGVRLEIQTKELGMIMRDQKEKKGSPRKGDSTRNISFLKKYIKDKITRKKKKSPDKSTLGDEDALSTASPSARPYPMTAQKSLNLTAVIEDPCNNFEVATEGLTGRRSNDMLEGV